MKKSICTPILLACLFSTVSLPLGAQERKHEFELGVGAWSTSNIIYALSDLMVGAVNVDIRNSSASGTFHAGYKYAFGDRFSGGATLSFGQEKADGYLNGAYGGSLKRRNVSLAGEIGFNYLNFNSLRIYGLAGAGGVWLRQQYKGVQGGSSKDNKTSMDFQLTPVGIKFGDRFGGFVELGIGYKGILNGGLFMRM
jgi:hypothetical protein